MALGSGHWQGLNCTNKKAETKIIDVGGSVKLFGDILKPSASKKHGQYQQSHIATSTFVSLSNSLCLIEPCQIYEKNMTMAGFGVGGSNIEI